MTTLGIQLDSVLEKFTHGQEQMGNFETKQVDCEIRNCASTQCLQIQQDQFVICRKLWNVFGNF